MKKLRRKSPSGKIDFHYIPCPIYRPVMVGERLCSDTDRRCGTFELERLAPELANTIHGGKYVYLRRVTTVPLQIRIQ